MTKLEELFQIEDSNERQKALVEYARALKINFLKAKKEDGQYSENELAVLIHSAEQSRKQSNFLSAGFFIVAFLVLIAVFGLMYILVNVLIPKG